MRCFCFERFTRFLHGLTITGFKWALVDALHEFAVSEPLLQSFVTNDVFFQIFQVFAHPLNVVLDIHSARQHAERFVKIASRISGFDFLSIKIVADELLGALPAAFALEPFGKFFGVHFQELRHVAKIFFDAFGFVVETFDFIHDSFATVNHSAVLAYQIIDSVCVVLDLRVTVAPAICFNQLRESVDVFFIDHPFLTHNPNSISLADTDRVKLAIVGQRLDHRESIEVFAAAGELNRIFYGLLHSGDGVVNFLLFLLWAHPLKVRWPPHPAGAHPVLNSVNGLSDSGRGRTLERRTFLH